MALLASEKLSWASMKTKGENIFFCVFEVCLMLRKSGEEWKICVLWVRKNNFRKKSKTKYRKLREKSRKTLFMKFSASIIVCLWIQSFRERVLKFSLWCYFFDYSAYQANIIHCIPIVYLNFFRVIASKSLFCSAQKLSREKNIK